MRNNFKESFIKETQTKEESDSENIENKDTFPTIITMTIKLIIITTPSKLSTKKIIIFI